MRTEALSSSTLGTGFLAVSALSWPQTACACRRSNAAARMPLPLRLALPHMHWQSFEDCMATQYLSGIWVAQPRSSATLIDSRIDRCHAQDYAGGGLGVGEGSRAIMTSGTITECSAAYGAGVYVWAGSLLSLVSVVIQDCRATGDEIGGGGIYVLRGAVSVLDSAIRGCKADTEGGGIAFKDGTLLMSGSAIHDCDGGGLAILGAGANAELRDLDIQRCKA